MVGIWGKKWTSRDPKSLNRGGGCQRRSEVGDLFIRHLRLLVGNGNRTFFWKDVWLGDRPLKETFPRLFWASRNKQALVKDIFCHPNLKPWLLDFRRDLRGFEVTI